MASTLDKIPAAAPAAVAPRGRADRIQRSTPIARLVEWTVPPFYWLMTRLLRLVVLIFGRYEVEGAERVPRQGGLIVVSNHLNLADPPLLGSAIPRRIRFMAKQELFDARPGGFFIRWFGAFPVRRFEGDLQALRTAQQMLRDGGVIGMFPEGHRSRGRGLQEPFPGTALIALRTGATVLPVAITGTEAITSPLVLLKNPRLRVVIGEPFTLPPLRRINSEAARAGTEEIMRRIAALLPPKYRGVYAERSRPVGREG
jgi:1-acyl-sn-glycerol-3-phosphate acyltransferase